MTPEMQELKNAYETLAEQPVDNLVNRFIRLYAAVEAVISLAERDDIEAGRAEMDAQARQDGDEPF